jgi:hypothetical protein
LERFFAARGVEEFSRDLALAWVDEACGFFDKEQTGTLKPTDVYVFRVAQMLGDYAVHGAVRCRYSRSISRLAGGGVDAVARFQAWLRTADRAASTVRTYTTAAGEFVAFLDTRGGMARCDGGAVEAFVATSAGYQFKTVEQKLCALRSCFAVFVDHVPAAAQAARTARVSCGVACSGHGPRNLAAMMTRRSLTAMSS